MDLTETIQPDSDQLDATDLQMSGPRTFTIETVSKGNPEQPVSIKLTEFPRVWRPGKSMRRVLVACWGADASKYVGRRVRLYCDPKVRFGGLEVGGTRVSHLSDIDKPRNVVLLESRGKSGVFVVRPLVETAEDRVAEYKLEWKTATPERRKVIETEVAALTGTASTKDTTQPPADEAKATRAQLTKFHTQLSKLGVPDADKLSLLSTLLKREVGSSADATKAEMTGIIDLLDGMLGQEDPAAVLASTVAQLRGEEA